MKFQKLFVDIYVFEIHPLGNLRSSAANNRQFSAAFCGLLRFQSP